MFTLWWLVFAKLRILLGFFAGGPDQCAKRLHVSSGVGSQKLGQRVVAVDENIAQGLQMVHGAGVLVSPVTPDFQLVPYGLCVGVAHQFAYILHLASTRFAARDAPRFNNRPVQG